MIDRTSDQFLIRHPTLGWEAIHPANRMGGPVRVSAADGTVLLRDCSNYVDDLEEEGAVLTAAKVFRKGGSAVVSHRGYFPFGGEVRFLQTCRYAANHMRVTLDIGWPAGARVRRHLGVGTLFLPGAWTSLLAVPPAPWLSSSSSSPFARDLPPPPDTGELMVAHWHRPPPAVMLVRDDGVTVEIGTGSDLWRWQQAFGAGPENGSWKLLLSRAGVRFVREPLMTCAEFAPAPRPYRLTWYAAWWTGRQPMAPALPGDAIPVSLDATTNTAAAVPEQADSGKSFVLDLRNVPAPPWSSRTRTLSDQIRDNREDTLCWTCRPVQKPFRRAIRRLAAQVTPRRLVFRGIDPGVCWDPRHAGRGRQPEGLLHWDMPALLDLAVWTRQQLGPEWVLQAEVDGVWARFPALVGLFARNGFETSVEEPPSETASSDHA